MLQLAIHLGCSHEQIATATGMPLGTVKTHARRGLIKIRQILADSGVLSPEDLPREFPQSQTRQAADTQDFPRIHEERASESDANTSSVRGDLEPLPANPTSPRTTATATPRSAHLSAHATWCCLAMSQPRTTQ